ncbi:hypothetical protein C4D60_Mb00t02240 [Musa balbisiana]|uniref:Uncharacterized protein n=1 Tax=Musa balbisiana TaxID=52838 RepID=A0A4S8I6R7_MUSBA|nr:hypothetical protein C4D60_Mb00t02240 [Musa balbisiana]
MNPNHLRKPSLILAGEMPCRNPAQDKLGRPTGCSLKLIGESDQFIERMMVLMMILHVFRVYLTGGFEKPRVVYWFGLY